MHTTHNGHLQKQEKELLDEAQRSLDDSKLEVCPVHLVFQLAYQQSASRRHLVM